jgi:hypothetical protein
MFKRIAIYCIGFFGVAIIVLGYFWLKDRPERVKVARELEAFVAEENAQKTALESLGDVKLELAGLNLARLKQTLHSTPLRQPGTGNTTRLGWACGEQRCAIWTSFAVPFDQEVTPTMTPAAILVSSPLFADSAHVEVGGVHVGDSVEEIKKFPQQRGYGSPVGKNRISWDEKWSFFWIDTNGKVIAFSFIDEKMIRDSRAHRGVNSTVAVDKRITK